MTQAAEKIEVEPVTTDGKVESRFDFLPIKKLKESKSNPRKEFGDLSELTASIKVQGVLEPLLVRKDGAGWEIICGARRFRSASKAEFDFVPCIVREMDDEQVLEAQISENALRLDPHPMEEAEAFDRLHTEHKIDVLEIAAKVGKTTSFVYQRLKLLDLVPVARKVFLAGKMTTATALHVARLLPDLQKKAVDDVGNRDWTQANAIDHIQRNFMLQLAKAPFDPKDADLVPKAGACGPCPKRSGNQGNLFGDSEPKDLCTDALCFNVKAQAAWDVAVADAKAKGWTVLTDKEVEGLVGYGGYVTKQEYVSAGSICVSDPKGRPWNQLLSKAEPTCYLARGPQGTIHLLYKRKEAEKALGDAGHKFAAARVTEQRSLDTAGKKAKEKVALHQRAVEVLLTTTLAKVSEKGFTKAALHAACVGALAQAPYELAGRRAKEAGSKLTGWEAVAWLQKNLGSMSEATLTGLMFEFALGRAFHGHGDGFSDVAKAVIKDFNIDPATLRKQAQKSLDDDVAHEEALKLSIKAEKLAAKTAKPKTS